MQPVVLSIAGFDPSSGAGVTADVKTAAAHGCFALTCITSVTVQTTQGVRRVEAISGEVVSETLFELAADLPIHAVRVGMLGSGEVAEAVAGFLETAKPPNIVLDPILHSSSGAALIDAKGAGILKNRLLALATLVTPNLAEATALTGRPVSGIDEIRAATRELVRLGACNVVVTGGHLEGDPIDLLLWHAEGTEEFFEEELRGERIRSSSTHGTGCAFATSVACHLARGFRIPEAVAGAKHFVASAIEHADPLGHGVGPMDLLWNLKK
ncbi:MAG TPA: bifunctional hydroxymethylpyrimidine kinase/phosphomethylpyrimidine kinase [Terriglobales bacterium]|nr:bifunctional hydroxymethylpyrimidine kinase/phosphomethylpyrimidine kinase [Terriglobales bacterium]